jgi:hypothetical protein
MASQISIGYVRVILQGILHTSLVNFLLSSSHVDDGPVIAQLGNRSPA